MTWQPTGGMTSVTCDCVTCVTRGDKCDRKVWQVDWAERSLVGGWLQWFHLHQQLMLAIYHFALFGLFHQIPWTVNPSFVTLYYRGDIFCYKDHSDDSFDKKWMTGELISRWLILVALPLPPIQCLPPPSALNADGSLPSTVFLQGGPNNLE